MWWWKLFAVAVVYALLAGVVFALALFIAAWDEGSLQKLPPWKQVAMAALTAAFWPIVVPIVLRKANKK